MPRTGKPPKSREEAAPPRRYSVPPFVLLLAVVLLVYANSLANGFVHDDKPLVAENQLIRDPGNLGRIFASGYWTTRDASVPELYRPLVVASFLLNHSASGPSPFGFHLVNLLLHAWVSWLVFRLGRELSGSAAAGWAAGLLFAVHPVHVEAVAPVVGRSELLAAGFALWALLLHRRSGATRSGWSLAGAAFCYLAAALSKENALALPAILLLTDLALPQAGPPRREGKVRWGAKAYSLYLLAAALYLGLRISVLGAVARSDIRPLDNPLVDAGQPAASLTAIITAGKYLGLLLWPAHLSADYSREQIPLATGWLDPRLLTSLAALAAVTFLAVREWNRRRLISASILFYGAAILPVSNLLVPIGTIFGERLLYLPSVGFCLAAGTLFAATEGRGRRIATLLGLALLLLASGRSAARNRIWRDDASFAFATARDAPRSAKAQFNLGVFLEERGDLPGADEAYRRAEALDPRWPDPPYNRGGVLRRLGRAGEAVEEYQRALNLDPSRPRAAVNLGVALNQAGRYREAAEVYRTLIRSDPRPPEAWNNLGVNLMALEDYASAAGAYREALSRDPGNAAYHGNLAQALEAEGDTSGAESEYRAALGISPDSPPLLRSLGLLLARTGRREEAARLLRQAGALLPGGLDPEARSVLQSLP